MSFAIKTKNGKTYQLALRVDQQTMDRINDVADSQRVRPSESSVLRQLVLRGLDAFEADQ